MSMFDQNLFKSVQDNQYFQSQQAYDVNNQSAGYGSIGNIKRSNDISQLAIVINVDNGNDTAKAGDTTQSIQPFIDVILLTDSLFQNKKSKDELLPFWAKASGFGFQMPFDFSYWADKRLRADDDVATQKVRCTPDQTWYPWLKAYASVPDKVSIDNQPKRLYDDRVYLDDDIRVDMILTVYQRAGLWYFSIPPEHRKYKPFPALLTNYANGFYSWKEIIIGDGYTITDTDTWHYGREGYYAQEAGGSAAIATGDLNTGTIVLLNTTQWYKCDDCQDFQWATTNIVYTFSLPIVNC